MKWRKTHDKVHEMYFMETLPPHGKFMKIVGPWKAHEFVMKNVQGKSMKFQPHESNMKK